MQDAPFNGLLLRSRIASLGLTRMGISVPISLPNGRRWMKKGDAIAHFKAMLARYRDGDRVQNVADHADLAALLKAYDAVVPEGDVTKIGTGISYFERGPDRDHPGHTSCFYVVRADGSRIDFSTRRALDVAGSYTSQ